MSTAAPNGSQTLVEFETSKPARAAYCHLASRHPGRQWKLEDAVRRPDDSAEAVFRDSAGASARLLIEPHGIGWQVSELQNVST